MGVIAATRSGLVEIMNLLGRIMKAHRALAILLLGALLSASSGAADWVSPIARDHPFVGKVWQPDPGTFVTPEAVEAAAAKAGFLLLGEKHDNADHHRLQARMVGAMAAAGRRPAVVFEMIDEDRQALVDQWRATGPGDAAGLGPALAWDQSGWPPWPTYRPIAEAALAAGLPLRAGNLPRQMARLIGQSGLSVLAADRRARLGLDAALDPDLASALRRDLFEGHCGLMPEAALEPLVAVQHARDAVLADNLARAGARADGAVLIAGAGHARADRAVPLHLARLAPGDAVVTIAFIEVEEGVEDPAAYGESFGGALPFDFLWFTPRANDRDYCAELQKSMGQE